MDQNKQKITKIGGKEMKKVMLICNAGMSSSLMAKKASEYLASNGYDIKVDSTTSAEAEDIFNNSEYDMILVSPQIRMLFNEYSKKAEEKGKEIAQVGFDAYSPTSMGISKMAKLITDKIG